MVGTITRVHGNLFEVTVENAPKDYFSTLYVPPALGAHLGCRVELKYFTSSTIGLWYISKVLTSETH